MRSGKLVFRPLSANFYRSVTKSGKMAPYVKVIVGAEAQHTSHLKKRTTDFLWEDNSSLTFNYLGNEMITIEVWHNKMLLKDKLIGSNTFSLDSFLAKNTTLETIPLFFEAMEAGTLQCEVYFTPNNQFLGTNTGLAQTPLVETTTNTMVEEPVVGLQQQQTAVVEEDIITKPVVTMETRVVQEEAIITRENPIIYEKNIIHEKPIITEKTIIFSEQPIIIEKPELHERVITEQVAPIVKTEQPVVRQDTGFIEGENLEGAVIYSETEVVKDQAQFYREAPILHQKDVILEKPIIHEKDIIYREKPVIVEKPEVIERHIYNTQAPIVETHETLLTSTKEFSTSRPLVGDNAVVVQDDAIVNVEAPIFKKELPDVFETNVIIEKPLITEKTIVHTEREVIHEKPEVHEKRIFHQDQTLIQKQEPLVFRQGLDQPSV